MKISKQEKNRILGLHLAESHNKKISSVLSEQPWDCGDKCEQRPAKVPPGSMVTAVMSTYFDGQKCKSLSYGGGVFRGSDGMEMCKACCEDKGGSDGIDSNVEFDYEWPSKYNQCATELSIDQYNEEYAKYADHVDILPRELMVPGKNHIMYCIREPYIGIPITNISYMVQDVRVGVSIEVCCGEQSLDGGEGETDINIDIDVEKPKKRGCNWRPEPKDEPTLDRNDRSINNIRICHEGENVKLIQQILLDEGYDLGNTGPNGDGIDGKFGNKTKKAVKDYQRKYSLAVDGIVGNETWSHMFPEEVEDPIIIPDVENEIINDNPMTNDELETFIEDNLEDKTNRKQCRDIMKGLSQKIKNNPYSSEVIDMIDNEELKLTLGYCLDERNYPGIMGHVRRIKKAFGLKGKGNN